MKRFEKRMWLSSPTMHGEELEYMTQAYKTNWMSTIGENINVIEPTVSLPSARRSAVSMRWPWLAVRRRCIWR